VGAEGWVQRAVGHQGDGDRKEAESWEAGSRGQGQGREQEDAAREGISALRSGMGRGALSGLWDLQAEGLGLGVLPHSPP